MDGAFMVVHCRSGFVFLAAEGELGGQDSHEQEDCAKEAGPAGRHFHVVDPIVKEPELGEKLQATNRPQRLKAAL
jgi:hypothetical protein